MAAGCAAGAAAGAEEAEAGADTRAAAECATAKSPRASSPCVDGGEEVLGGGGDCDRGSRLGVGSKFAADGSAIGAGVEALHCFLLLSRWFLQFWGCCCRGEVSVATGAARDLGDSAPGASLWIGPDCGCWLSTTASNPSERFGGVAEGVHGVSGSCAGGVAGRGVAREVAAKLGQEGAALWTAAGEELLSAACCSIDGGAAHAGSDAGVEALCMLSARSAAAS